MELLALLLLLAASMAEADKLYYMNKASGQVTLISLDSADENCLLAPYPAKRNPAALNFMPSNGTVVACGGHDKVDASKCFAFDGSDWTSLPDSKVPHCEHDTPVNVMANTDTDQVWWIAGAYQTSDGGCQSEWVSEIFNGNYWVLGPVQPVPKEHFSSPCVAQLNATHSLYTGGFKSPNKLRDTWLYNWETSVWTEAGKLNDGRYNHGCAVAEGVGAVVAGGAGTDSVELFDQQSLTWSIQPSLPEYLPYAYSAYLLSWRDTVLGLFSDSYVVYERTAGGTWIPLDGAVLPEPFDGRGLDVAVIVPDEFANGCM